MQELTYSCRSPAAQLPAAAVVFWQSDSLGASGAGSLVFLAPHCFAQSADVQPEHVFAQSADVQPEHVVVAIVIPGHSGSRFGLAEQTTALSDRGILQYYIMLCHGIQAVSYSAVLHSLLLSYIIIYIYIYICMYVLFHDLAFFILGYVAVYDITLYCTSFHCSLLSCIKSYRPRSSHIMYGIVYCIALHLILQYYITEDCITL